MELLKYLSYPIDLAHFILLFFPIMIYFIHFPNSSIQIMFLLSALVPLSWYFYDHKCVFSVLSSKLRQETEENEKNFSERYLEKFYFFIQNVLGFPEGDEGFNKAIFVHWIVNMVLLWFYLFFIDCQCHYN